MAQNTPITEDGITEVLCNCEISLQGTVFNGTPNIAESAKVFLFRKGMVPAVWKAIDSTSSDQVGYFEFNNVPADSFIIRVEPDIIQTPGAMTSYYIETGFCFKWDSAGVFYAHCDSGVIVKDVHLITPPPLTGNSSLNGYVFENTGGLTGKKQPGDPIPGIDITVEQSPGGVVVGGSTTGLDGFYNLADINTNATYIVSIDFPGLPHDSVYKMTINGNDTILDSLNFYIDNSGIYILEEDLGVGINVVNNDNIEIDLFPNPSNEIFNLNISAIKNSTIELELTNEFGQQISRISEQLKVGKNKLNLETDNLPSGIYFLKVRENNNLHIKKLIKL
jgi:hypothetical protein